mgnify:CR=1 FL=1
MQVMAESLKAYTCIACAISVKATVLFEPLLPSRAFTKKKKEKEHLQERISHFPLPKLLLLKSQFE